MPSRQLPPELLQQIRDLAAHWGKIVGRRTFGDDGPGLDIDFDTMEPIAEAAAAGLAEGTLAYLFERQAQRLGSTAFCPDCGTCCPLSHEPCTWQRPGGSVTQNEPVAHGPACRRDFFPSTPPAPPQ